MWSEVSFCQCLCLQTKEGLSLSPSNTCTAILLPYGAVFLIHYNSCVLDLCIKDQQHKLLLRFDAFVIVPEVLSRWTWITQPWLYRLSSNRKDHLFFLFLGDGIFLIIALLFYIRSVSKVKYIFILTHSIQEKLQKELKWGRGKNLYIKCITFLDWMSFKIHQYRWMLMGISNKASSDG